MLEFASTVTYSPKAALSVNFYKNQCYSYGPVQMKELNYLTLVNGSKLNFDVCHDKHIDIMDTMCIQYYRWVDFIVSLFYI